MEKKEIKQEKKSWLRKHIEGWSLEKKLYVFSFILVALTLLAIKGIFSPSDSFHTYTVTEQQNHTALHVHPSDIITIKLHLPDKTIAQITTMPTNIVGIVQPFVQQNNTYTALVQAAHTGSTTISVTSRPQCTAGHVCPLVIIQNFQMQVEVNK